SSEFVWLKDLNNDAYKRQSDHGLSENLNFQLKRGEKLINLHLKENPRIRSDIDMYVVKEMSDGTKRAVKEPVTGNIESKQYYDMDNVAAITVRCVKRANGPCTRTLEGGLIIEDKYFRIAPVSNLSHVDSLYTNRENQETCHLIREETTNDNFFNLMNDTIRPNISVKESVKRSPVNLTQSLRNVNCGKNDFDYNKRANIVYGVEIHIVVDPPVWKKQVAITFKTIQDRAFSIEITLKAITVIKNETEGPYETAKLFEKDGIVSIGSKAYLHAFADWVLDTLGMPSTSDFDHAMVLTGYNLPDATGIAFVGGVCETTAASVVTERGYWNTMIVASHELGHSFGAYHDNVEGCPEGSIMWWHLANTVNTDTMKAWTFSECSIDVFEKQLAEKSCVQDKATFFDKEDYDNYNKLYPGQIYSIEEQCKIAYGPDSRTCGKRKKAKICASLSCYDPQTDDCYSQLAADGTECGTGNKWCIDGFCVSK
ncbi:hypothetical protein ACJMK2_018057, partial [Sinanodonta woodiana]